LAVIAMVAAASMLLAPAPAAAQSTERLYQQACDDGDLIACNVFGLMFETGQGVPRDIARAAALYQTACEGGELVGCTNVGVLYEAGSGIVQDRARAAGFYRVACEGGEQLGCALLRALEVGDASVSAQRHFKSGRVGDVETNRPLDDAIVELPELGVRAVSDAEGRFGLPDLPPGRHPIRVERLGYDVLDGMLEVPGNPNFVALMTPATDVGDPNAAGQIVGLVTEAGERSLAAVDITVLGQERARTLSNQQGRFTIRDVQPGLAVVRFARIGYAPRTATLIVQPGRTAEVVATMAIEPIELEAIEVTVRSRDLERDGFYSRADAGFGTFFTPSDMERLRPIDLSDLFRGRVPGVQVVRSMIGDQAFLVGRRSTSFNQGECRLPVYVDGIPMLDNNVELLPASSVAAVEVYQGVGTPVQYGSDACGVVLIWTRRGN
jgi:hypothetical protein